MTETEAYNDKQSRQKAGSANVLIVDSDSGPVRLILEILAQKGICANVANNRKTAVEFLDKNNCDLIFTSADIDQPNDGFELLRTIKKGSPELPVVMLWSPTTDRQDQIVETAVKAMRYGCSDFIIKPASREKIQTIVETFVPNHSVFTVALAQQASHCLYQIVGRSPKLVQTVRLAVRIAPTSAPVLISGESGTGKELISFLIHQKSKRALGPYIRVNCAALSDSLLESELFGHEKGAFTGAYTRRKGRFEMADRGSLLLDEITETPLRFQAKLLRLIEQQEFERVGGNENIRVNVRIISTTNKDLLEEVRQDRLRRDLYYRLSGVRLEISPLRERTEDLPELVWHFVNLYAHETNRRINSLDPAMMDIFARYDWPGNVRQLRNVVLTSLILGVGPVLSLADVSWLFDELQPLPQAETQMFPANAGIGGIPLEQVERRAILDTLRQTAGNQAKAAKVLGISDRTLRDKIRRYRQSAPGLSRQTYGGLTAEHAEIGQINTHFSANSLVSATK